MTCQRIALKWLSALAVVCVALAPSQLRADPLYGTYTFDDLLTSPKFGKDNPGFLEGLVYDPGPHPDLRSPGSGTMRFLVWPGGNFFRIGVQAFAFNTDLALNPSQLPPGVTATPNALVSGLGRFSWVLTWSSPSYSTITGFDITGLGANASPAHFVLPAAPSGADSSRAWFAAEFEASAPAIADEPAFSEDFWASASVPATAPEPSTLVLAGLGFIGLCGRIVQRRK